MFRKQRQATYGAWHVNTAQAIIILIALGCGGVVYNAYQQAHEPSSPLTLTGVTAKPDAKQARYAREMQTWQAKTVAQGMTVTWPYLGHDNVARVDLSGTAPLPKNVLREYLIYLTSPQNFATTDTEGKPVASVTKADLSRLLQYSVSNTAVSPQDLAVLRFYLQPGQGLNNKILPDPQSVSDVDLQLLRQCLQTKRPIDESVFTSQGLPARLSLGGASQILSAQAVTSLRTFYGQEAAVRSYGGFARVRKQAQTTDPTSCIVHVFAPNDQAGVAPGTMEELAQASASGVGAPPT